MQLFQRTALTSGPLHGLCRVVYRPLKIVPLKLSCFTAMLWEPAVLQHTLRGYQLINNNGGFNSLRGCWPMEEATEPQGDRRSEGIHLHGVSPGSAKA